LDQDALETRECGSEEILESGEVTAGPVLWRTEPETNQPNRFK